MPTGASIDVLISLNALPIGGVGVGLGFALFVFWLLLIARVVVEI